MCVFFALFGFFLRGGLGVVAVAVVVFVLLCVLFFFLLLLWCVVLFWSFLVRFEDKSPKLQLFFLNTYHKGTTKAAFGSLRFLISIPSV